MTIKSTKQKTWRVHGRCLKSPKTGTFKNADIKLPEYDSGLRMGARTNEARNPASASDTFGIPIDSKLAINLIRRALSKGEGLLENLKNNSFDRMSIDLLKQIVDLNYGITFDKTVMLKILSQPNCAGLRAYLCARDVKNETTKKIEPHLSLVMVGVDVNGYDLNYSFNNIKSDDVPNESLLVEYGYPPGGAAPLLNKDGEVDEHYVLLKFAQNSNL